MGVSMARQKSRPPLPIDFITLHNEEPDLIISFVVAGSSGSDSVTLMRTPKFEYIEDAAERGVRVYRDYDKDPLSIVPCIHVDKDSILIEGSQSAYALDISRVEDVNAFRDD